MITEERKQEVLKQLRRGEPAGEIKESLKAEGYADDEIETAFPVHRYNMMNWFFFFGAVSLVIAVYLLYWGHWFPLSCPAALFIAGFREKKRVSDAELSKMIDDI